jgi:phosphoribosylformylglycinamidine synthase
MTTCTIDEAVRRLIAVGGDPSHIGGVDNFCWPSIQYDAEGNPDGKFKAAQLVRSCRALKEMCVAYEIPLLSGKDSMYVDGHLTGRYGESHKISALETLQFSATSLVPDIHNCASMDLKMPGDLVYVLGVTHNELGGSEYYEHLGYIGARVPRVDTATSKKLYEALHGAISKGIVASAHGIYRGGLGIHLAMIAMGGGLGLDIDLGSLPSGDEDRDDVLLFSESAGRFIVSVDPKHQGAFEASMAGLPFGNIGAVTETGSRLTVRGCRLDRTEKPLIDLPVSELKEVWMAPLGELI